MLAWSGPKCEIYCKKVIAIIDSNDYNEIIPAKSLTTEGTMATLTIRKLDSSIKESLRIQAAQHGISMEEEARRLLRKALIPDNRPNQLGSKIHRYFLQAGGVNENIIPQRSAPRKSPDFSGDQVR
jgi:plasmid stability protein